MFSIELNHTRSINDPIHGSIKLSKEEMCIVEHSLFKRLHHVRQNSFLYKVFPSAKHTRFEHSLGVMHLAAKMFNALIENSGIASQRGDIETNFNRFQQLITEQFEVGINLHEYFVNNKDDYYKAITTLRYASLLHDIGHGPLSHLFDSFAPTVNEFKKVLDTDTILKNNITIYKGLIQLLEKYKEKTASKKGIEEGQVRVEHEHVSLYFITKILTDINVTPETIMDVLTILKPEICLGKYIVKINGFDFNLLQLLNDIVASAPIDCDRMDYLKRDSYFAGVPYGNYSEDRVLKSLLPYATNKELRLGIKISGLHAVENFLQARYEMFVQVYGHKTNEACAAILNFVCKGEISFKGWSNINMDSSVLYDDFQELYTSLTDESFLEEIIKYFIKLQDNKRVSALTKLQNRELWKRIYEIEEFISIDHKETEVDKVFNKTVDEMKNKHKDIFKFSTERFPLKDLAKGARLLEKSSKSIYVVSSLELNKASQIIESLNHGLRVWRIYGTDNEKTELYKSYVRGEIQTRIEEAKSHDKLSRV